jgi:hypothetical protein
VGIDESVVSPWPRPRRGRAAAVPDEEADFAEDRRRGRDAIGLRVEMPWARA